MFLNVLVNQTDKQTKKINYKWSAALESSLLFADFKQQNKTFLYLHHLSSWILLPIQLR
jgi:hypothetical protein